MDHVELKPYPFPGGMDIPRLMPEQDKPWNGDGYLAAEVLRLKKAHGVTCALETGTCLGSTTLWLAENFDKVWTCEVNAAYYDLASERFTQYSKPHAIADNSFRIWNDPLTIVARRIDSKIAVREDIQRVGLVFLDAHWNSHCPLLNELEAIAKAGAKPCIIIHDFHVPGTTFGFDSMPDGTPFCYNLIEPYLIAIYGEEGFKTNYPTKVEGANRGWISVEPVR
jgi:hypothetical protein